MGTGSHVVQAAAFPACGAPEAHESGESRREIENFVSGGRAYSLEKCPISSIRFQAYRVPTDGAEADGTLAWSATTVVVVEVGADGVVGTGWTYGSEACAAVIGRELTEAVMGIKVLDVPRAHEAMVRSCRNLGRPGIGSCAISAVDVALWDLKARVLEVGLAELLGRCHDQVALYGSGGFTTYDDERTREQLAHWVHDLGIPRAKIKVGESWGTQTGRDLARVGLARQAIGDDAELYVDANGAYSAKQAIRVGRRFEAEHGVVWFEEPVSSDDLAGLHLVREQVDMDVAAGEYGYNQTYFHHMLQAQAVDCLQVDVTRCGGYTSWLRAAALAAAHGLEISGHCAPHLHGPVAQCVPNIRHIEYFHDHVRVDALLFNGLTSPRQGCLEPEAAQPGHGMTLDRERAGKYELDLSGQL